MPDFEDLMLCDLLKKVQNRVAVIAESRRASDFKELGADIQAVYNYFITTRKDYTEQQPVFKNLFSTFNYAAVIINDAAKSGKSGADTGELLQECLEIISACCEKIINAIGLS